MFRSARVNARGTRSSSTKVGKCGPDIEVGKSAVARDYGCVCLSGLVLRGYLLSQEAPWHRGFSVFAIPSCVGVVSFRVF